VCHDSLQKGQFSEVKPSHTHFWEPLSLFPTVTRARSKSHNTPNIECLTILFKKVCSVRSNPHKRTFENLRVSVFSRQLLVRVVNHTILLIRSVSRFYAKHQFSEVKPSHTHFSEPPSLSRQLLVRVVNHTLLLIRSVSRFYAKHQFSEVKPSHTHFSEPPSLSRQLLVRVVNHTLLLIRSVSRFSTKYQFSKVKPSQSHFWKPPSLFSAVTRARSKSHNTPNTECVTILYKKVSSVTSNPHSRTFEDLRVFFLLGSYLCV